MFVKGYATFSPGSTMGVKSPSNRSFMSDMQELLSGEMRSVMGRCANPLSLVLFQNVT
jgi:hypothetical protein